MLVASGQSVGLQNVAESTGSSVRLALMRGSDLAAMIESLPPSEWPDMPMREASILPISAGGMAAESAQSIAPESSSADFTWLMPMKGAL